MELDIETEHMGCQAIEIKIEKRETARELLFCVLLLLCDAS